VKSPEERLDKPAQNNITVKKRQKYSGRRHERENKNKAEAMEVK
jgi:hypothetical protein